MQQGDGRMHGRSSEAAHMPTPPPGAQQLGRRHPTPRASSMVSMAEEWDGSTLRLVPTDAVEGAYAEGARHGTKQAEAGTRELHASSSVTPGRASAGFVTKFRARSGTPDSPQAAGRGLASPSTPRATVTANLQPLPAAIHPHTGAAFSSLRSRLRSAGAGGGDYPVAAECQSDYFPGPGVDDRVARLEKALEDERRRSAAALDQAHAELNRRMDETKERMRMITEQRDAEKAQNLKLETQIAELSREKDAELVSINIRNASAEMC